MLRLLCATRRCSDHWVPPSENGDRRSPSVPIFPVLSLRDKTRADKFARGAQPNLLARGGGVGRDSADVRPADVESARDRILSASPCSPCLRGVIWTRQSRLNHGATESTEKRESLRVCLVRVMLRCSGPRIALMCADKMHSCLSAFICGHTSLVAANGCTRTLCPLGEACFEPD